MTVVLSPRPKPSLRGWSHLLGALVAVPAGAILIGASRPESVLGAVSFSVSLFALLATSATYHTPMWEPRPRMILRRIDHSMIYLLVAGSYTPFCLALGGGAASTLLPLVWGAALLGMLKSVLWVKAPRFVTALAYVLLGWAVVPWAPELGATLGNTALILIGLGGLFYSVGAVIYARKSPDPNPKVFGYHEIFHVLVIAAAVCHYGAVWLTVT